MRSGRLAVLAIAIVIGVAACGGSSKSASSNPPNANGNAATTTASGSTGTPTTAKLSGDSSSAFCAAARKDQSAFSGPNVSTLSAASLKQEFENLGPALKQAQQVAPDAIKGDFATFIAAFQPYLDALKAANYDFTKLDLSSVTGLQAPNVKAASQHIESYFEQVCHISPPTT